MLTGLAPGGATAATMTFDSLPGLFEEPFLSVYAEAGILATGSDRLASYDRPRSLHLDDSGTDLAAVVAFTALGRFDALSLDIHGLGQRSVLTDGEAEFTPVAYDDIRLQGYRDGRRVAFADLSTGIDPSFTAYSFGAAFRGIDRLTVEVMRPQSPIECFVAPCSHVNLDNLTLAPVPLPAALPLAVAGLGLLAVIARRRG